MLVRLQKLMAERWIASRRKSEEYILWWLVKVNWVVVNLLWTKIDPEKDSLEVDWKAIKKDRDTFVYYMLNKPLWYVTTTHATEFEDKIVTQLVPNTPKVYPVWRLDKDTTWLLLMTNDGDLAFKLTHPSFEHEKEYEVLVNKKLSQKDLDYLWSWRIKLFWKNVQKSEIKQKSSRVFSIILKEGMNRQIRRMVRSIWLSVEKLRRVRMWNLFLWDLEIGQFRKLTKEEVIKIKDYIQ